VVYCCYSVNKIAQSPASPRQSVISINSDESKQRECSQNLESTLHSPPRPLCIVCPSLSTTPLLSVVDDRVLGP
jgi:hypothetical protein